MNWKKSPEAENLKKIALETAKEIIEAIEGALHEVQRMRIEANKSKFVLVSEDYIYIINNPGLGHNNTDCGGLTSNVRLFDSRIEAEAYSKVKRFKTKNGVKIKFICIRLFEFVDWVEYDLKTNIQNINNQLNKTK